MSDNNNVIERVAPQLLFDDGSRIIQQSLDALQVVPHNDNENNIQSPRGSISIFTYYEIEKLSNEIWNFIINKKESMSGNDSTNSVKGNDNDNDDDTDTDDWSIRIALQFPDNLLCDSPEVCWKLEDAIKNKIQQHQQQRQQSSSSSLLDSSSITTSITNIKLPLIFILGDTTFGPCCPDEIAALHLQADILIHYGHACLSHPSISLPVLYSFGITENWNTHMCVNQILQQIIKLPNEDDETTTITSTTNSNCHRRLLLLYQVKYQHAMEDLQTQLSEHGDILVVMGQIPSYQQQSAYNRTTLTTNYKECCQDASCEKGGEDQKHSCCNTTTPCNNNDVPNLKNASVDEHQEEEEETFQVGGLQLPKHLDYSTFSLVFIGDYADGMNNNKNKNNNDDGMRQYINTLLWYLSTKSKPTTFWTYSPLNQSISTSIPSGLQRQLNRRFYLIQKARDASIFGILIGTLSQQHFQSVVQQIRHVCQNAGRACYTLAMGKVNSAKIANFAEIDCFIMVACAETSWLEEQEQREMHVPIITPLELYMALGSSESPEVQWGTCEYSLNYNDFLQLEQSKDDNKHNMEQQNGQKTEANGDTVKNENNELGEEEDAPYFSLVTGKYETSTKGSEQEDIDLKALPGKGQLTTYKSEAAAFLQQRQYKGMETQIGETEIRTAIPGQEGIASQYNTDKQQLL